MRRFPRILCSAALLGLFGLAVAAQGDEKVPPDKLPKPVVDAVKARFPGAELKGAEKEKDGDKVVFDVALKHKDQNYEVAVTPEGEITTIEHQIPVKDLPKVVVKTLEEKYPKATYKMVEEVYKVKDKKETLESYEVAVVTADKKQYEVYVAPDGKLLKATEEKAAPPAAEKIAPDKLPKAVMDAIKGRFPDAQITSAEKETEDGKVVYDIELKSQGKKYEMDIQENGTIVEIEKEVAAKNLPEAVKKALEAKYPKATIKEIMEVNKVKGKTETPDHYEVVLVTAEKKEVEVEVSLDGKTVKGPEGDKEKKESPDEGKVSLDQVPKVVKDALKAKFPKAEVVSAEKGDQDGTKVFEFELKQGEKKWEASFTPDGKFAGSEEAIKEADLPAKVKEAFQKKYPKAKVLEMERAVTGEGKAEKVVYEIIIEADKGKLEIQFDPDGKVLGEEKKK